MSQVLTNLIKNAAESIEAEGGEIVDPTIYVGVEDVGDHYQVKVSDNGKGWPKENRLRLLEPYNTTRDKGTGLGLAIVSKIVEQHNGRVDLYDAPADPQGRVGAVFAFTLPKRQKKPNKLNRLPQTRLKIRTNRKSLVKPNQLIKN